MMFTTLLNKTGSLSLLGIVLGLLALSSKADAACMQCTTDSYAACLNETAFHVCYDGLIISNQILLCPEGTVCTSEQGVCMPRDQYVPSCLSTCKKCANQFACVSQTEFDYCDSNGLTGIVATCPTGQYCNLDAFIQTSVICSPACSVQPSCSNEAV